MGMAPIQLPDNRERFRLQATVLGSEGFTSGKHCWDVEIGQGAWLLGVATESFQRKEMFRDNRGKGLWVMGHVNDTYGCFILSTTQRTSVIVKQRPQKIRVQLDLDRSELTFSDPDNDTQLHTFSHAFTERVFPYFRGSSFKILPLKPAVTLEQ